MSRSLEITVISAEDIKRPAKKPAFVIVRTDHFNQATTELDDQTGNQPSWNQKLLLDFPLVKFLTLEVFCGKKKIGFANIPVTDFTGGLTGPVGHSHFLSYRLMDERGDRKGIINVSVKVKGGCEVREKKSETTVMGYKDCPSTAAWFFNKEEERRSKYGGGTVVGIPVWF